MQTAPSPSGGTSIPTLTPGAAGAAAPPSNRHKNVAWIENQIRKDQHEAVNPKYKLPFKSKDDAIKRLLNVFKSLNHPNSDFQDFPLYFLESIISFG